MLSTATGLADEPAPDPHVVDDDRASFIDSVVARVCEHSGLPRETVLRHATEIVRQFAHARVQSFVPVLVEKQLRERLRQPAEEPA